MRSLEQPGIALGHLFAFKGRKKKKNVVITRGDLSWPWPDNRCPGKCYQVCRPIPTQCITQGKKRVLPRETRGGKGTVWTGSSIVPRWYDDLNDLLFGERIWYRNVTGREIKQQHQAHGGFGVKATGKNPLRENPDGKQMCLGHKFLIV